ncbi:MAG: hypothetical protein FJY66_00790 [Calditrichaeota bacterium]|nr:hypothetical protein [Calditrichota bacterium]
MFEDWKERQNPGATSLGFALEGRRLWLLALLQFALAAGTVGYWLCFFLFGAPRSICGQLGDGYLMYERAFPAADGLLSVALLAGAIALLRRCSYGPILSIASGGALIFLGVLDTSFNLMNGIYFIGICQGVFNGVLNLVCIVSGVTLVSLPAKHIRITSTTNES